MKRIDYEKNGRSYCSFEYDAADYLTRARVPPLFCGELTSSSFVVIDTHAITAARRFVETNGIILILAGSWGVGKSLAAAWLLSQMFDLKSERWGLWVNAQDLVTPPEYTPNQYPLDHQMKDAEYLVIDEVGLEHSPGGYAQSRIVRAIESRHAEKRRTILTTNLSAGEFAERYGGRLASRINGDPVGWITCGGRDLRQLLKPKAKNK